MKTINTTIYLYSINELGEESKQKAINKHRNFLESQGIEIENKEGKLETVEFKPSEEEIIENIEANDYLFFIDGSLAPTTKYTGNHPLTGLQTLLINGQQIFI